MKTDVVFRLQYERADIEKLEEEYLRSSRQDDRQMEEAGKRIVSGDFHRKNLEIIYRWRSARRIALLANNSDVQIATALKQAVEAADIKEAVCALISPRLTGVGVKMASAILTAINPKRYTVLDHRALKALGVEDANNLDFYVLYVESCVRMADEYGVSLRTLDRANRQWSKNRATSVHSLNVVPWPS